MKPLTALCTLAIACSSGSPATESADAALHRFSGAFCAKFQACFGPDFSAYSVIQRIAAIARPVSTKRSASTRINRSQSRPSTSVQRKSWALSVRGTGPNWSSQLTAPCMEPRCFPGCRHPTTRVFRRRTHKESVRQTPRMRRAFYSAAIRPIREASFPLARNAGLKTMVLRS
jgi:hypothetical protein